MKLKHACVDAGQYGLNVSPDAYVNAGVRLLRTSDLKEGGIAPPADGVFLEGPVESRFSLEAGDLLVSRSGTIGRSHLAPADAAGSTFAGFLIRFRPNRDNDGRFLNYVIQSRPIQEQIVSEAVTSTIQNFNADRYANLEIPEHSLLGQRRIADFLDDRVARTDRIIAARQQQSRLLEEARRSIVENVLARSSHGRVQVRRLLAEAPAYGLLPKSTSDDPSWPRYIRTTDIGVDGRLRPRGFVSVNPAYLADYALEPGDVLVSRSGTIGKCMVFAESGAAVFAGYLVRLRFADIDARAYWYFSQTRDFTDQVWANAVQSTIPNFNAERYASMWMPDLHGDSGVFDELDQEFQRFDSAQRGLESSIALLAEYKQSLITAAVIGALDVNTAGSGIPA